MSKQKINGTDVEFEAGPDGQVEFTIGEQKIKIDKNGQLAGAEAFGNKMEKVEGGMKITRPDGVATIMHDDGNVTVENLVPKSVGLKSLADVTSYAVRSVDDVRVHRVEFINGGHLEVSYAKNGDVAGFTGYKISQTITADSEVIVGSASLAPSAPSGSMH